jgi:hypothetical protein
MPQNFSYKEIWQKGRMHDGNEETKMHLCNENIGFMLYFLVKMGERGKNKLVGQQHCIRH